MRALLAILIVSVIGCADPDWERPSRAVKEFMSHIPGSVSAVCAKTDTDGDGYVSCTIFRGERDPLYVDCPSPWTVYAKNNPCRGQKTSGNGY